MSFKTHICLFKTHIYIVDTNLTRKPAQPTSEPRGKDWVNLSIPRKVCLMGCFTSQKQLCGGDTGVHHVPFLWRWPTKSLPQRLLNVGESTAV